MRSRTLVRPLLAGAARFVAMGHPANFSDVCVAAKIPASHTELLTPTDANWTAINVVSRARLQPLTETYGGEPLTTIKPKVISSSSKPAKGALKVFKTKKFESIPALITFYEEAMSPVRALAKEIEIVQLDIFGLRDHLKLGLSVFKPEQLTEKTKKLKEAEGTLAAKKTQFAALVADSFDTAVFNDIANALRICGEASPEAREMAERVLEDMTLCEVPFDECTKLLLKNVLFNDGPFEDSGLLFAFVEYPERGEIDISNQPLEKIADKALLTISQRHQTPINDGIQKRSTETHPNLQRSME